MVFACFGACLVALTEAEIFSLRTLVDKMLDFKSADKIRYILLSTAYVGEENI